MLYVSAFLCLVVSFCTHAGSYVYLLFSCFLFFFMLLLWFFFFFFSSRRRHTRCLSDWSSDVCSSDLTRRPVTARRLAAFDRFFNRHGAKTVFVARFVTGLRVFCAFLAGSSEMA